MLETTLDTSQVRNEAGHQVRNEATRQVRNEAIRQEGYNAVYARLYRWHRWLVNNTDIQLCHLGGVCHVKQLPYLVRGLYQNLLHPT
jgi:hypothetical protein